MVTISHMVNKLIDGNIYLQEAIGKGIASYGSIAKKLKPDIEDELRKEVAHYAIVAAIRRYSERMNLRFKDIKFDANTSEVNLKTNIIDINVLKTLNLFDKLKHIYDIIQFEKGDMLHIIYGKTQLTLSQMNAIKKIYANSYKTKKSLVSKRNLCRYPFP